jgi:uncharacterized protein (DUF2147 family)
VPLEMKAWAQKVTASVAAAFALVAIAESLRASPIGLWLSRDGGKLRIVVCGNGLCGFVAGTNPQNDPATGLPFKDKNNPDPAKRNRPLIGVQSLSLRPDGAARWSGSLYNDDDGRTYSGRLIELGPTRIRIEGCALAIVCGGEELTRIE